MRPVVVTLGPLATAAANNIALSQTPAAAGFLALAGALATTGATFTASIATNVLTVTAVASGTLIVGMAITAPGLAGAYVIAALGTGAGSTGTYFLNATATLSSTTVYGNAVATLDVPRRVLVTTVSNESGKTLTITGTGATGGAQSETMTGPNGTTGQSVLDYATVTSIAVSAAFTGAVTVGTNGVASSKWMRFDDWAPSSISLQCTASGTVNYTVQSTLDNPNDPISPVALASMTWVSSSDGSVVAATTTQQTNFAFAPRFARVLLNSGTGTVTTTYLQSGAI